MKLDWLRGSVRPLVTYLVMLCFAAAFLLLVWRFSDKSTADKLIDSFRDMVLIVVGFWFGARQNKPPPTP